MMTPDFPASDASVEAPKTPRLPPVLIYLLKGVLYRDQHPLVWHDLEALEGKAADYFKTIGLDLTVDEAEGFAYLKQAPLEEDDAMPRLIPRRPLSYPVSVLCVLLRKKMVEADAGGGVGNRVVLTREQIVDMMRVFSPQRADEAFTEDQIEAHIRKAVELDLLKPLKSDPPAYEVRPIIKALVDADWLQNLDEKIRAYQEHGNTVS
ncbi:MAG: DUF4194 domain-containing protein [Elusimicrobiota bacterium]|jgi:hypothetical protein